MNGVSPLAPERFPELAPIAGVRLAAYAAGVRYAGRDDLMLVELAPGSTLAINGAATLLRRATGRDTHPLFRFPYGARDSRTLAICHRLGYVSVRWTVDTEGWMGLSVRTPAGAVHRVVDGLVPGEIVLMHLGSSFDHSTIDANALPAVIRAVRRRGYRFVTMRDVRVPR